MPKPEGSILIIEDDPAILFGLRDNLEMSGFRVQTTVDGEAVTLDPLYKNVLFAVMILSAWAFFGWFWHKSGQTLGMHAWRIRVENADGGNVSVGQTVKRFAGAALSALPLGLGYWMMLASPARQTLHDRLSGSRVVMVPKMEKH